MTHETIHHNKGFTLLEIVVSLIVASILGSMLLVYVGTAYNKSVEPVAASQRMLRLEQAMEKVNAVYAGLLNKSNIAEAFDTAIKNLKSGGTIPAAITYTSKQFDFQANGEEPGGPSETYPDGNLMKVVLTDASIQPTLELISLFSTGIDPD